MCEDFEGGGGNFAQWMAQSSFFSGVGIGDTGRIRLSSAYSHSGRYAVYMPADPASGYQGASLDWYACIGQNQTNCPLRSFDSLFFRVWVRFDTGHRYIHHFLSIGGSQPGDFWYHGTAGCLADGVLDAGVTVDYEAMTRKLFFYTYFPGMKCDTACQRYMNVDQVCQDCASKGLPTCTARKQCCWGNNFYPPTVFSYPAGWWFCMEIMMKLNSVGQHNGVMAVWIDDSLVHHVDTMMWRVSPTLALNRVRLQHYIETSDANAHSNRVWFDDMVVGTRRIGMSGSAVRSPFRVKRAGPGRSLALNGETRIFDICGRRLPGKDANGRNAGLRLVLLERAGGCATGRRLIQPFLRF